MAKRTRTRQRWDELYHLAQERHRAGWTEGKSNQEVQSWAANNLDLSDGHAIATARSEYKKMTDPRLAGSLPQIRKLAQAVMDKELPGTKLRFNHEFFKICRYALDHKVSVSVALHEIASRP